MMTLYSRYTHYKFALYKTFNLIAISTLLGFGLGISTTAMAATSQQQPRAVYYRYYDSKGVATISKSVSPTHIRRGYDALDQNMYLIYKVPPYNVEADLKQEQTRAARSIQQRKDEQIKRSYRTVAYAVDKKEESLKVVQKQINQQYQQMRQLQEDRSQFLQQKSDYVLNKKPVPTTLQKNINNNAIIIRNTRNAIEQLKLVYNQQERHFDYIISRLQTME